MKKYYDWFYLIAILFSLGSILIICFLDHPQKWIFYSFCAWGWGFCMYIGVKLEH